MARISVYVDIAAPREAVWREAADLGSHAEWMVDAESIEFLGESRSGVGTRMKVETVVGPLRTTDLMEVVEWKEGRSIGVRHTGLVAGVGRFELSPIAGRTRFSWTENLTFQHVMGGGVTAFFAKPVLRAIWSRNLRGLKRRLEAQVHPED